LEHERVEPIALDDMSTLAAQQTVEGAVSRALRVLQFLALSREPSRLSAIAIALSMQKSTVHRILTTLGELGYVEQIPDTACYRATLKLWELGTNTLHEHPVKRAAAAFLHELHRATGETVSLTVLSGDDVLYLDKIMSPRAIRFTTRVGSRAPAALTAGGKAMLAHLPNARAVLERTARKVKKERGFAVAALVRELAESRERGYAVSSFSPGVISIAAAIFARDGRAAAALSVSAPVERVNAKKRAAIIEHVRNACANMSEQVSL
jgi:DNA-binding IclR family transcriptional regulator